MCTTPFLATHDFKKTLESDAFDIGIGAILTQDGQPLAFIIQALSGHNLGRSKYEKEMMAILHAVHMWWTYILGFLFRIKTNHHSLTYFLEQ
jgi:hypothetical protein